MPPTYFYFNDQKHSNDYFKKIKVESPIITALEFKEIIKNIKDENQIEDYLLFQLQSFLYHHLTFSNIISFDELKLKIDEWFSFTFDQLTDLEEPYSIIFHLRPFDSYDYYLLTSIRKSKLDIDKYLKQWISQKYTLREWENNPDLEPLQIAIDNNINKDDFQKIVTHRYKLFIQKVKQKIKEFEKDYSIEQHKLSVLIHSYINKSLLADIMTEIDNQYGINTHLTLYESWPLIKNNQPIFSNYYDINSKLSFVNHEALFIYTGLLNPSFDILREGFIPDSFKFIKKN
jgi:hypothetical protein